MEFKVISDNILLASQNVKAKCVTWAKWTVGIATALKEGTTTRIKGLLELYSQCCKFLPERKVVVSELTTNSTSKADERDHFGKSWTEITTQVKDLINKFDRNDIISEQELKNTTELMWSLIKYDGEIPPYECVKYSPTNIIFLDYCCSILFKISLLKANNAQDFVFNILHECLRVLQDKDITKGLYERVSDFVMNVVVGETSLTWRNSDTIKELLNIGNDEQAKEKYDEKWLSLVQQINELDDKLGKSFR